MDGVLIKEGEPKKPQRAGFMTRSITRGASKIEVKHNSAVETCLADQCKLPSDKVWTADEVHKEFDGYRTPMGSMSLRDQPEPVTDEDEELPRHLKTTCREFINRDLGVENMKMINPTKQVCQPPEEMIEQMFLMPPQEDGTRLRAKTLGSIVRDHKKKVDSHPKVIKLKCLVNKDYKEVVAYNDVVDYIEQEQTWDGI